MVFSVLMFENLRFSASSIFLVFAFPGMCVISVLQDTHFQKDAIIYFLKLAQLCLNHFVFKRVTAYPLVLVAILGNTLIEGTFSDIRRDFNGSEITYNIS